MLSQIQKALKLDWPQLYYVTHHMHKRSGRSHLDIFSDMLKCYKDEGYTWLNYLTFGFDEIIDPEIRSSYLSEYRDNTKIIRSCNTKENMEILEDKGQFNRYFKDFLGRDSLDLRLDSYSQFREALLKHKVLFIKTPSDCGGDNILRIETQGISDPKKLYDKLLKNNQVVVEEAINQDPKMNELSLKSVNTLRVATAISLQGKVSVAYMTLRFNTTDAHIDNASVGGAFTLLTEEGLIKYPAYINYPREKSYSVHPANGMNLIGFQVPQIQQVKDLVCTSAMVLPHSRYIGWDVAITPSGPVLVEANSIPSVELFQARIHMEDGRGKAQLMQELLGLSLR